MLRDNDRIPPLTFLALMVGGIIEVGLLTIPRSLGATVGNDAFLVIPFLFLIAGIGYWIMFHLASLFPNETLIDYLPRIVGKGFSHLLSMAIILFWVITLARMVRALGDMTRIHLLLQTPIEVIHLSILLIAAYLARHGIEAIGRAVIIIVILVLPIITAMILLSAHEAQPQRLLPLFSSGFGTVFQTAVISLGVLEGTEIILMVFPFLQSKKTSLKVGLFAIALIGVIVFLAVMLSWAVMGSENLTLMRPTLSLVEEVDIPAVFLQQLTILFAGIWVPQLFATLAIFLFLASLGLGRILGQKEQKQFVLPLVPIIYLLSVYPISTLEIETLDQMVRIPGGIFYLPLPLFLLIVAWIKGYRRPKEAG